MKKFLVFAFMTTFFVVAGCDNRTENGGYYDDGRAFYVSVNIENLTSGTMNVYKGDAFYMELYPGERINISDELFDNQAMHITLETVYYTSQISFHNEYQNYNVRAYDSVVRRYP